MIKIEFLEAEELLLDSFKLGKKLYDNGFIPTHAISLWRGGTPVGLGVDNFFRLKGHFITHTTVATASYSGINSQDEIVIKGTKRIKVYSEKDPANLPWKGIIPFAEVMSNKFGVPVALTNDANAAAIGEMTYGAARGMKDFIMITLGTGVGSGIVSNGHLIYGHDGFAGELGHVIVRRENGRQCGCGSKGCLETYTSATGVARTAREFLETRSNEDSMLRKIALDTITSKDVFDAAQDGDQIAKDVFAFTGQVLGEALADFVKFSSPEAIILFGGLAKSGDLLMKPLRQSMEDNLMPIFKGKVKLLFSEMKDADAAILGASALAWESK